MSSWCKKIIILSTLVVACNVHAINANLNQVSRNTDKVITAESSSEKININTADAAALQKIKGFGKKKSLAVVEYRDKNGPFKSIEDLLKVKARGLNQKWLDKISKFLII